MKPSSIPSENSFESRKRIEEMALQQAALVCPAVQKLAIEELPSLTAPYAIKSIDTISKAHTPLPSFAPTAQVNEALISKCEAVQNTPPELQKPIDRLFYEIMKILASDSSSMLKTRELLITANNEWQKTLENEMLASAQKSRNINHTTTVLNRVTHAIAPASAIIAGIISLSVGTVPVSALAAAAIGGLFFIDSLFDDAAKKYIASILAKQNNEEAKVWLQRIQLFSSIVSFCTSFGISAPKSLTIATSISKVALSGIETGADWMKKQANANTVELNSSFEISQSLTDELMKRCQQIMKTLSEIYKHQHDIEEANHKTHQACHQTIQ